MEGQYDVTAPLPQAVQTEPTPEQRPIDLLAPKSEHHARVLKHLLDRLNHSERTMSKFYGRWNCNERRVQAYINLPDYEKVLKEMSDKSQPPQLVSITVPYSFATLWTIVTYLVHTFCGQKPIFQVSTYNAENVQNAQMMETVLQYNADHSRLIAAFFQWFVDDGIYGLGVLRTLFKQEKAQRTVWTSQSPGGVIMPGMPAQAMRQRVQKVVYEGNEVVNVDPFMFFPDPRVPMKEVNRRGEYVFWRSFEGKHTMLRAEQNGELKWVRDAGELPVGRDEAGGNSDRNLISSGDSSPGDPSSRDSRATPYYQVDQGTVEIVPKELGLGEDEYPQKWIFTILNKNQIVQAEPFDYDHGRHPVAVIESLTFGYGFGQAGIVDMLGPIQDSLSWFVNSQIYNVRSAINNMFVVDPSMVEMQDLKDPGPGKYIRLKRSAYGQDVRTVLQQLQVQDVTKEHMQNMELFMRMGDALAAVNDNLKGIQEAGGRKTATEVRTAGEAGASRLAAKARYISSQGMVDLAEQMALNLQQFMTMSFYLQIVGMEGLQKPIPISPEMVAGDYYFPVHDGTLPIDKVALIDVWKEVWMAVISNPAMQQQYDAMGIFEYLAQLAGAKNIQQFKVNMVPDQQAGNMAADGQTIPIGPGAGPQGGIPGVAG